MSGFRDEPPSSARRIRMQARPTGSTTRGELARTTVGVSVSKGLLNSFEPVLEANHGWINDKCLGATPE